MYKACIVGREGTTGLRIDERLQTHPDVEVLPIPEELRKDVPTIMKVAKESDVVFLCLPDQASRDIVAACQEEWTETTGPVVIDASTAFRVDPSWAYGFPELSKEHRQQIQTAKWIANPGCHASGMIAIWYPLIQKGLLTNTYHGAATSLTGYSGGGKSMIQSYEGEDKGIDLYAPRHYALGQQHKHLPEVVHQCGLATEPIIMPIVDDYYSGMLVSVPLVMDDFMDHMTMEQIFEVYQKAYQDSSLISVESQDTGMISANTMSGHDGMKILVTGQDGRVVVHALYDNLGKGASGAAIQNMNIALGLTETTGLHI